jgi:hypothetical protein
MVGGSEARPVLGIADVADFLGVTPATISQYLSESRPLVGSINRKGRYADHPFPEPNGRIGNSPWWSNDRAEEIQAWAASRPGQGAGGGRPRKSAPNEPPRQDRPRHSGHP